MIRWMLLALVALGGLMAPALGQSDDGKKDDKAAAGQATPSGDPDEPPKDAVADYQLLRAADLIRGISLYSNRGN